MTLHTKLSYIKSVVRVCGFAFLPISLVVAALILVIAEVIGIVEENPGSYVGTKLTNNVDDRYN